MEREMYRERQTDLRQRARQRETKIRMERDGKAESDIREERQQRKRDRDSKDQARGTQIRAQDQQITVRMRDSRLRETEAGRATPQLRSFLRNPGPAAEVWPGQCSRCP